MQRKKATHNTSLFLLLFMVMSSVLGQITIKAKETQFPVSYATVSFGNGNGLFADDEGVFVFTKKLYPDVDSLYISALGYKNLNLATSQLADFLFMESQIDELDEVVIRTKIDRKYTEDELKPYLDDDYYHCWLPTIESEIAVYFPYVATQDQKIASVQFPITLESKDWDKRKRKNAEKQAFSTLFKVKFYDNNNGVPGNELIYDNVVFRATETDGDNYQLDVSAYDIFIPKSGVFVSLQVLGYTDAKGKLLPNKKYKEIKGPSGSVKIPTNFRPLLPFTDKIPEHRTYIKRVFISNNKWVRFEQGNGFESGLLKAGLTNYGIGLTLYTYKDE